MSQHDDPSQHDIPRPSEVVDSRHIHEARIQELLQAIRNDVEDLVVNGRNYSPDQRQLVFVGIRECASDMVKLSKLINEITWDIGTELRNNLICTECGFSFSNHVFDHPFTNAIFEK